jgi:AraC-like DNA-binding protein
VRPSSDNEVVAWRAKDTVEFDLLKATFRSHSFGRHWHDHYVVGIILDGVETFWYRGATHIAEQGSIVLVNPGEVHTGSAGAGTHWHYRALYPPAELLQQAAAECGLPSDYLPDFRQPVVHDPVIWKMLRRSHIAFEERDNLAGQSYLRAGMVRLVGRYSSLATPIRTVAHLDADIDRVVDFMHEHYAEDLSLEKLADIAMLSRYHFLRVFQRKTGLPPHQHLLQIRVMRARDLLRGGASVGQAALETGFVDQSHLTKCFKRVYGITPGAYR